MAQSLSFFLGANTPKGFYSLFDELYRQDASFRLHILKGGPGTGKSSFMKRIADAAEARGIACARIFCSADPGSLDAVILPALHTAVADGTSPHVLEPKYPGVRETLIDLGAFRDDGRLCEHAREVIELTDENKRLHKRATAFLNAAGAAA